MLTVRVIKLYPLEFYRLRETRKNILSSLSVPSSIPLHFPRQEMQWSTSYINKIIGSSKCWKDQVPTVSFKTYVIFVRFSSTYAELENSHPFKALGMQSVLGGRDFLLIRIGTVTAFKPRERNVAFPIVQPRKTSNSSLAQEGFCCSCICIPLLLRRSAN